MMKYAGFRVRFGAALIDAILIALVTTPPLLMVYGWTYFEQEAHLLWGQGGFDFFMTWLAPAIATILFWRYCQATPAKMLFDLKIVDATTGQKPTTQQWVIRYVGYFVSLLPLGLGYLWVAFDPKKQSFHDKMANTLVIYSDES